MQLLLVAMLAQECQTPKNDIRSLQVKESPETERDTFIDSMFFIDGQLCQHVRHITQTRDGTLWIGTNVYGLIKYDSAGLHYIDSIDGYHLARITGLMMDSNKNLWIAHGNGLHMWNGKQWTSIAPNGGWKANELWCIAEHPDTSIWIGTNDGIYRFADGSCNKMPIPKAEVNDPEVVFADDRVVDIVIDDQGNVWIGRDGYGITYHSSNGQLKQYTEQSGLCDNTICDLMLDDTGQLWVGTFFGGLCTYDGVQFNSMDGVEGKEIGALYQDHNGDTWFSSENVGIYRYHDQKLDHFNKAHGLESLGILSFYRDQAGVLWLGGWGGLFRMADDRFEAVTKESLTRIMR